MQLYYIRTTFSILIIPTVLTLKFNFNVSDESPRIMERPQNIHRERHCIL